MNSLLEQIRHEIQWLIEAEKQLSKAEDLLREHRDLDHHYFEILGHLNKARSAVDTAMNLREGETGRQWAHT